MCPLLSAESERIVKWATTRGAGQPFRRQLGGDTAAPDSGTAGGLRQVKHDFRGVRSSFRPAAGLNLEAVPRRACWQGARRARNDEGPCGQERTVVPGMTRRCLMRQPLRFAVLAAA